jgi:hypothetical protein
MDLMNHDPEINRSGGHRCVGGPCVNIIVRGVMAEDTIFGIIPEIPVNAEVL